jgi:hypothetical protein
MKIKVKIKIKDIQMGSKCCRFWKPNTKNGKLYMRAILETELINNNKKKF